MNLRIRLVFLFLILSFFSYAKQISIAEFEHLVWRFSNIERTKNSLPPLKYDDGLADLSRIHSRNMLGYGFFDHKDHMGRFVNDRKKTHYPELIVSSIGENLARFYNTDEIYTPEEIVTGWMNSPEHRENILNKNYTYMGVGVVNHEGFLLVTQTFANSIVKRITPLPTKIKRKKLLKLEFEYMSPINADELTAVLLFPDSSLKHQVGKNTYAIGNMPVKINWTDKSYMYVDIRFVACKGDYELVFGYKGGYYESGVTIKVK